jgi:hypothetical protein
MSDDKKIEALKKLDKLEADFTNWEKRMAKLRETIIELRREMGITRQ